MGPVLSAGTPMAVTGNGHSRPQSCFWRTCTSPFPVGSGKKQVSPHKPRKSRHSLPAPPPAPGSSESGRRLWGHDLNGRPWWPRAPSASSQWKGEGVAVLAPCPETALGQSAGTQSQADTQTHPLTQPPARPLAPEGRCKSSHVPSKGSVWVPHSARRGTPSWVFLAPKILASGEPPCARSCTRRYAVPGDQTQVRRSTSPCCSRPCLRGLGDASGGELRPPGPPAPSV